MYVPRSSCIQLLTCSRFSLPRLSPTSSCRDKAIVRYRGGSMLFAFNCPFVHSITNIGVSWNATTYAQVNVHISSHSFSQFDFASIIAHRLSIQTLSTLPFLETAESRGMIGKTIRTHTHEMRVCKQLWKRYSDPCLYVMLCTARWNRASGGFPSSRSGVKHTHTAGFDLLSLVPCHDKHNMFVLPLEPLRCFRCAFGAGCEILCFPHKRSNHVPSAPYVWEW